MAIKINRVTNANVYIEGGSMMGRAEEVKLPDVVTKMVEHKALGLLGTIELPSGFDKLEGEIKWSSFYTDVMKRVANPFAALSLQVRASVDTYESGGRTAQKPLVVFLTVSFKSNGMGTYKQHDNVEIPTKFSCTYIKQVLDGEEILELDVMSNIFKVGGVDLLADFRNNLG